MSLSVCCAEVKRLCLVFLSEIQTGSEFNLYLTYEVQMLHVGIFEADESLLNGIYFLRKQFFNFF